MTGTFINVGAVVSGSLLGMFLGTRFPERIRETVLKGLGLLTLVVGMQMALKTENVLILMGSILIGGMLGELLHIQHGLDSLGNKIQKRFSSSSGDRFSEGFVTASLVFCVGPLTILGSIQDGLTGDYQLLGVKSMLDGFSSLAFAAAFGLGVLFSAGTVLIFQGTLTLGASFFEGRFTTTMIDEMTATGGLIVLGIGLVILNVTQPRVANFLPALVIAPFLAWLVSLQ